MPPEAPAQTPTTESPATSSTTETTPSPDSPPAEPPEAPAAPESFESSVVTADEVGDPADSSVDWDSLSADSDEVDAEAPTPVAAEEPPAPAPPAASAAAPPTEAEAPPVVEPPVAPPAAPAETPQAPAAAPAPQPQTPEQEAADRRQAEELLAKYTGSLETFYALPEELASQMQTEPEVALPKLAARLHIAVENAVMERMRREVPGIMDFVSSVRERDVKAKEAFYSVNEDLRPYEQQVLIIGKMFREANPNATAEEAIEAIGTMTRAALKLPARQAATAAATPPPPPAAPPGRAPAFRPANPGGAGPAAAPPTSGNPFEALADEFIIEDSTP